MSTFCLLDGAESVIPFPILFQSSERKINFFDGFLHFAAICVAPVLLRAVQIVIAYVSNAAGDAARH
jgi:hypothetical protein